MKRFGIAVCALLLGAGAAVPTCAVGAMPSSALRAPATESGLIQYVAAGARLMPPQDGFILAQYGGGGDPDDDPPQRNNNNNGGYQQPYQQPQQHRNNNNNNNNFNNGAAAAGALFSIINGIAQQKERERQQRLYDDNQRRQKKHQQDIANERRQQDIIRKRRADAERIERIKREEQIRQIEDAKRDAAKKNQYQPQPDPYQPATNQNQPQPDPYQPVVNPQPDQYHDKDPNNNVINIVPAPVNCPDNFAQLKIGPTILYPRRTDYPADPSLCSGKTANGCYLRVQNAPASCGGSAPTCVAYCGTPAPPPAIKLVDPTPTPTPPKKYVDDPKPVIVVPPPVVKVTEEAKKTGRATEYTEPKPAPVEAKKTGRATEYTEPKPAPVEAKKTVKAGEYTEPKPAPVEAKKTVKAGEYTEPKPAPVEAKKTAAAGPYVEPAHKDKPAEKTADKRPMPTVVATPDPKPKPDEPESFEFDSVGDPPKDEQKKPPVKTVAKPDPQTKKPGDPDNPDFGFDSVLNDAWPWPIDPVVMCNALVAARNAPRRMPGDIQVYNNPLPPNESVLREEEAARRQYEETLKNAEAACKTKLADDASKKKADDERKKKEEDRKKQEAENKRILENPGPLDSKGCTVHGDRPIATLIKSPDYRGLLESVTGAVTFKHPDTNDRDMFTGLLAAVPKVGGALSGVLKFLWKDPTSDALFNQMKAYVDALVPDSITNERMNQQNYDVGGLRELLEGYQAEEELFHKGLDLKGLVNRLKELGPAYLNNPDTPPERAMALVVAYGALRLTALQEMLLHQNQYFPGRNSTTALTDFNDAVKTLRTKAQEMKDAIIVNRLSKMHIVDVLHDAKDERPLVEDGFFMGWPQAHYFSAHDDFCAWNSAEHKENRASAQADLDRRKAETKQAYERDLDELLKPIAHWPSLTPMAQATDTNGRPLDDAPGATPARPTGRAKPVLAEGNALCFNNAGGCANPK